ncbi:tripartite tricarboxylate transporter TctB family protein [Jannaschia aquimarina]|uniref:Tripartite tricarboxylate transporter TctB family protein n=1 Tax=Jannaschia aquimarina TaxID=935700 RepID=A0A0D1EPI8_9RHOB|nr:tripartite tricarboxylate transporter TctB family protein [Jannaschia aquimarina]KIT17575.1 Tripartite tricarboxylate transporter TctB family protein [Jannaschia aquimarina]SNS72434.1 Tripartite tricarboxylate transporter TctB family protein [Jannaschia aquimarina]
MPEPKRVRTAGERGGPVSAGLLFHGIVAALSAGLFLSVPALVGNPVTLFGAAPEGLSPDVMPRLVLAGVFVLGTLGALAEWREGGVRPGLPSVRMAITAAASFAFAAALVPFGFLLASAAIVAALGLYLGARRPMPLLLAAVVVPAFVYVAFTRGLHVALPAGPLGF